MTKKYLEYAYMLGKQAGFGVDIAEKLKNKTLWDKVRPWALPIGITGALGAATGALMPGGDENDLLARTGRGAAFGGAVGTTLAALRGHEFQANMPWLLPLLMTAPWIIGDPHGTRKKRD
jgi:hypothetical protein